MNIIRKIFAKRANVSPLWQVHRIMHNFIEACLLGLEESKTKSSSHGMAFLLFMLGAVDMLSQTQGIDEKDTLILFRDLLKEDLGGYSEEDADTLLNTVVQASGDAQGHHFMKEGAETIKLWISGVQSAPHRLSEILSAIQLGKQSG